MNARLDGARAIAGFFFPLTGRQKQYNINKNYAKNNFLLERRTIFAFSACFEKWLNYGLFMVRILPLILFLAFFAEQRNAKMYTIFSCEKHAFLP